MSLGDAGAKKGGSEKGMDRRRFLELTGAGTGALLAGAGTLGAARADAAIPATARKPIGAPHIARPAPDVVVIGAGAFGGWTALNLRRLGATVTVVDLYGFGNSRATSGGETRGVRTSYGDRPHGLLWGRWANEAIRRWKQWNEEHNHEVQPFFYNTHDVIMRDEWTPFLENTAKNWDTLGIEYEKIDADEVRRRWPVIWCEDMTVALVEPQAGVVRARRAMESVGRVYEREGGELVIGRAAPGQVSGGRLLDVTVTPGDRIAGGTFVWALGPWFPKVLPDVMTNKLRIPMGHVFYFGTPPGDNRFTFPNLPSYNTPGVTGWPALPGDNRGFRVRTGGHSADDPDTSARAEIPEEGMKRGRDYVVERFPDLAEAPLLETRACHYELSVTRNFIVDHHPEWTNTWLAGGGCAEGFKSGPVIGEYVAHRVLDDDIEPDLAEGFKLSDETFEEPG